jgi:hypothetical protein
VPTVNQAQVRESWHSSFAAAVADDPELFARPIDRAVFPIKKICRFGVQSFCSGSITLPFLSVT